jgi:hypothetical protein
LQEVNKSYGPGLVQLSSLPFLLLKLDRPTEAIALLPKCRVRVARARNRMAGLRALAAEALGDDAGRKGALEELERDGEVNETGTTWFLAAAGSSDAAARRLMTRLENPWLRTDALTQVQEFGERRQTPRGATWDARWKAVLARPDVRAAIQSVGTVGRYRLRHII